MYFLVPTLEVAKRMVDELLLARIEERHLPVLARRGTPLEDLSEASFMQKSDFVHAVEQGVGLGGAAGSLSGWSPRLCLERRSSIAGGVLLAFR